MGEPTPGPFGSLRCGCTLGKLGPILSIEFCNTHRAAPDLLEALEDCVRALEAWAALNNEPDEPETTRARAAIAKARGES